MKKLGSLILIVLFFFTLATASVNICSAFAADRCHQAADECCIKSSILAVEGGRVFLPMPEDHAISCDNSRDELFQDSPKFILISVTSYIVADRSLSVTSANPSNAPPSINA